MVRVLLIAGFESFNIELYRQASKLANARCPNLDIHFFNGRNIAADCHRSCPEGCRYIFRQLGVRLRTSHMATRSHSTHPHSSGVRVGTGTD
jgi:hypothetical protein